MTPNIEEPPPSNKKLWIILASISSIVIGCSVIAYTLSGNSSEPLPPTSEQSQSETGENQSGKTASIPSLKHVEANVNGENLVFSITVKDIDMSKAKVEYQIADQDRVVKAEGTERTSQFKSTLKLAGSAYYRVKVRSVNDDGAKSQWSESQTVELSKLKGMKSIEPSPRYYETGWAKGTSVDAEDAKEAVETAWGITEVTSQFEIAGCLPLNTGKMAPKLLLPPIPSVVPGGTTLKYIPKGWDGSALSITYVWCQE